MRDFKKIIAWQKAHALSVAIGPAADWRRFRKRPRLRSQLLRAIDSIGGCISEGAGKPTTPEFARYLDMAMSSAREVDNHLLLARDIDCMNADVAERLLADVDEIRRILFVYTREVRRRADDE
ncbi:MAG: four helix bundle protein [Gemmatimonadota bacterium]